MSDDIEEFVSDSGCYIESLIKSRVQLDKLPIVHSVNMIEKIEELIMLEIGLAIMGANKAKSEILKKNKDDVVKPIK